MFAEIDSITGAISQIFIDDGHVLGDTYYINLGDDTEEYIEITRIEGDQIWGKFQLSMYRRDKRVDASGRFRDQTPLFCALLRRKTQSYP